LRFPAHPPAVPFQNDMFLEHFTVTAANIIQEQTNGKIKKPVVQECQNKKKVLNISCRNILETRLPVRVARFFKGS
jgi:hypothetical protein